LSQASVLALLFRLELSETPDVTREVLPLLTSCLSEAAQTPLRRSVRLWLHRFMERALPGVAVEDVLDSGGAIMARTFATWQDFLEDRGMQRGRAEGKAEGRAEGQRLALRTTPQALVDGGQAPS
jgi:hypothetical protein